MGKKLKMTVAEMKGKKLKIYYSLVKLDVMDAFYKPSVVFDKDCVFKFEPGEDEDCLIAGKVWYKERYLTHEDALAFVFHPNSIIKIIPDYENDNRTSQSGSSDDKPDSEQSNG